MAESLPRLRTPADRGNLAQNSLCLALGAGFTLALFLGMAHFSGAKPAATSAPIEDLRVVAAPFEPPPPPRVAPKDPEPAADQMMVTGFELSPSDSPVKIAVSPPNLSDLSPTMQLAPPANIQIGQLHGEFRPKMTLSFDVQHVYQKTEVDSPPTILFRGVPAIPQKLFHDTGELRVTLLFVVEITGAITSVQVEKSSGVPDADAIVAETVQNDWGFTPATKKGRKVRCLLEQPIIIRLPRQSKFNG